MNPQQNRSRSLSAPVFLLASLSVLPFVRDASCATQSIGAGFHRASYWKELVEFSREPGSPESAIAVLISDLHGPSRLVPTRGRQSVLGTAVIVSSCHA